MSGLGKWRKRRIAMAAIRLGNYSVAANAKGIDPTNVDINVGGVLEVQICCERNSLQALTPETGREVIGSGRHCRAVIREMESQGWVDGYRPESSWERLAGSVKL